MPAKNHLSKEQKERLLKTLKEHENPYVREKILILLLMNDGKTYQEISKFLDIAYPTGQDCAKTGKLYAKELVQLLNSLPDNDFSLI
jgi:hypothetical protein